MRRCVLIFLALCLAGCAPAPREESQAIVGLVVGWTTASTRVGRPGPFTLVGAAGGLVGARAFAEADSETHIHNRLYVKTAAGERTVDTDQYFPPGACVEIEPFAGDGSAMFFPYRSAYLRPAGPC